MKYDEVNQQAWYAIGYMRGEGHETEYEWYETQDKRDEAMEKILEAGELEINRPDRSPFKIAVYALGKVDKHPNLYIRKPERVGYVW